MNATSRYPRQSIQIAMLTLLLFAGCSQQTTEPGTSAATPGFPESDPDHAGLVGKPAPPFQASAWVNGEPTSLEQLKGKVVLLDFWAVWCGPCISTFPHLRELHEKYGSQGLAIVGLTDYSGYGFNTETGTIEQKPDLSQADEQTAVAQFAQHHQLPHPLGILAADSSVNQEYGVTGIPQMVLIDRQGKIRLVLVGAGEETANALDTAIQKLLAEPESPAA